MPVPTPFHPRTSKLCSSLLYKDWAGYFAVRSYDTAHDQEYFSVRHAAGVIDVTPLYKYEVRGPDAARFLAFVMVKDIARLKVGRVTYLCWCDEQGKVVDDGTVARLEEDRFRVTAAEPALAWLQRHAARHRVSVEDVSVRLAALAVQGPRARAILTAASDAPVERMKFFGIAPGRLAGVPVEISRTGYTGDLGYEVWVERDAALRVWDALQEAGRPHRLLPVGLDALDVLRVEAGFLMNGVDYWSAHKCPIESRKSTPFELGLKWTVDLDRDRFLGQEAIRAEARRGPRWSFVGLEIDWDEYEALFAAVGLPPQVPAGAWRTPVPVFDLSGRQVGQATSGAWSPILKKNLALASVRAGHGEPGTRLLFEVTVEFQRRHVTARVARPPFFDPERKRGVPR